VLLPFDPGYVCSIWFDALINDLIAAGYLADEALRPLSVLLHPVLPERTVEPWRRLGWTPPAHLGNALSWGNLSAGQVVVAGPPLFPREVGQS
jgi:methionyl-tRNA synthetase